VATVESSPVTGRDVEAARAAVETIARRTPVLSTRTISERAGGVVALKAENLQSTGSFKVRGTAAKLAALGEHGCKAGVVAASAGNHAQAVALAARTMGVPCEVFVPGDAPIAKTEAARGLGAIVHLGGASVDECLVSARERSREGGLAFIHPFDDPDDRGRPGLARARAARGRARSRQGRGAGRRRRAVQRDRDRGQVGAARRRDRRSAGRGVRALTSSRSSAASRSRPWSRSRSPTASR
jgi:hypothetical protein